MTERGRSSDYALMGRGSNQRLIYVGDIKANQGAFFYCPECRSDMHYNRGNAQRVACFKHNRSVPQKVKDNCPIYSGAVNSETYGEELGSQLTVALQITRGNDPRWIFKLRLPRTNDIHENVVVKAETVRKAVLLTGVNPFEDVQITPRRARYTVEADKYTSRLRRRDFDARVQAAFVFPLRASETSARTRRLFWGLSYYVFTEIVTPCPLDGSRILPAAQTKENSQWSCV